MDTIAERAGHVAGRCEFNDRITERIFYFFLSTIIHNEESSIIIPQTQSVIPALITLGYMFYFINYFKSF